MLPNNGCFFFSFEIGTRIMQAGLKLIIWPRRTLNFGSPCLYLLSAGVTGMHDHTGYWCWGSKWGFCVCWASTLITELHPQLNSCFLMFFFYILINWCIGCWIHFSLKLGYHVASCQSGVFLRSSTLFFSGKCYGFVAVGLTKDFKVMYNVLWNQVEEAQFPARISGFWYKRSVKL